MLFGRPLNSSLGIAAGPLLNSKWVEAYARLGFDVLTYATVRSTFQAAHALPNIRHVDNREQAAVVARAANNGGAGPAANGLSLEDNERHLLARALEKTNGKLKLIIHEGRRRQVRLMCAAVGHPVSQLVRTRIGEVLLGRLPPGKTRPLSGREVASLKTIGARRPATFRTNIGLVETSGNPATVRVTVVYADIKQVAFGTRLLAKTYALPAHGFILPSLTSIIAEVNPGVCQGCGTCQATCPSKSVELQGFTDDQIWSEIQALGV